METKTDKIIVNNHFKVEYRDVEIFKEKDLLYCNLFENGFKNIDDISLCIDLHIHEQTQNPNMRDSIYSDIETNMTTKNDIQYSPEEIGGFVPADVDSHGEPKYYGDKEEQEEYNLGDTYEIEFKKAIGNNNFKEIKYLIETGINPNADHLKFIDDLREKVIFVDYEIKKEIESHISFSKLSENQKELKNNSTSPLIKKKGSKKIINKSSENANLFKIDFPFLGKSKQELKIHLGKLLSGEKTSVINGLIDGNGKAFSAKLQLFKANNKIQIKAVVGKLEQKQQKSRGRKI